MEHVLLYLAYKDDNGYLGDHKTTTFGLIYRDKALCNIKVIACPFCDVSTSSGEIVKVYRDCVSFECTTCQKIAFSTQNTILVTKEKIKELYPRQDFTDDVVFHSVKLYKIMSVSNNALMNFSAKEPIANGDVLVFYNDLEKFGDKNKTNVNGFIDSKVADKFLKDNKLAKKYKIEYINGIDRMWLSLIINDYMMFDIPFRGKVLILAGNMIMDIVL